MSWRQKLRRGLNARQAENVRAAVAVYSPRDLDEIDHDHLLDLTVEKITASTSYAVGYAAGRIVEYVAQNAIPEEALKGIVREAYQRVYDGPANGPR